MLTRYDSGYCVGGRPVAELLQRSDPARCVFGHAGRLVIEPSIPIRLAAGEHEEDGAQELVCQGDDGLFGVCPTYLTLILLRLGGSCIDQPRYITA